MIAFDLVQTVAVAGIVLFAGYAIRRRIGVLDRYNIPAPVVGGLVVAAAITVARRYDVTLATFDTTLQTPLQNAFFASVGFGASLALLRVGGPLGVLFFLASTVAAVGQNLVGMAVAWAMGQPPLLGVLAGSVTLTGGPATGLAFAPLFEEAGVPSAATLAVAAAMAGIVAGGLIGGPISTWLIRRHGLAVPGARGPRPGRPPTDIVEAHVPDNPGAPPAGEDREAYLLLKTLVVLLTAVWIGGVLSDWAAPHLRAVGLALPSYIGAMLVAAFIRNLDDVTGLIGLSQASLDDLGNVALSLFLVLALMTLKLWEIVNLALPLAILVAVQVVFVAVLSMWPIYRLMGRDYEGAVTAGGFTGFMLGTTANAMANMEAVV
ncbi:MAG TPA: sodium/glutamate symporter, partial [Vicinamibacterales bacterium]